VDTLENGSNTLPRIAFDRYISREYLQLEKERLWPRVWQIACREEEIPSPGDYITYDIADASIVVVRTASGQIGAYHNVCVHRGRRLVSGCGTTKQFRCGFHGWKYDLDGCNSYVQDPDDWKGALQGANLNLRPVRVDCWAGFVWVDMRPRGESLQEYLETVPEALGPYEYEKMRFRWYKTLHLPCNWKVAVEAFFEGYHVAATHPQLLSFMGDDRTSSFAHGKHASFGYPNSTTPLGMPSPRTQEAWPKDPRPSVMHFFKYYEENLKASFTERDYLASTKLMEMVPEGADAVTAFFTVVEATKQAAIQEGAGWPEKATFEHFAKWGADWHVFPNFVTLPWFDGALAYRARPDADNPDKCIFDIWSLVRYAPGKAPPLQREVFLEPRGDEAGFILNQDIRNMSEVQRGMKTRAVVEGLPNPVQEVPVINFHSTLDRYIERPETR
jgi:phenylpropionate dioxygenase-like ring-hydroxylating dioxygenase large terminal subunit